jgi:hypothetical protein
MENKEKINYNNLREHLELLLNIQGIPYIQNVRKELNTLNQFVLENVPAETVLELIGKLIYIKKHKNYANDKFWIGCAVNLADAYSYRVKIETVYSAIAPPEEKPKPTPRPEPIKETEIDLVALWSEFLKFSKTKLTTTRFEQLMNQKWSEKDSVILIETKDEFLIQFVSKYFRETHKVEVKVHE